MRVADLSTGSGDAETRRRGTLTMLLLSERAQKPAFLMATPSPAGAGTKEPACARKSLCFPVNVRLPVLTCFFLYIVCSFYVSCVSLCLIVLACVFPQQD